MDACLYHAPRFKRFVIFLSLSILILALGTCKGPLFGLGGAVDLQAPRSISIAPGQGSYRSGVIAVSGVAEDAYGLFSVEVRILERGSGSIVGSYAATISGNSWTTGGVVNTASFPDGLYTISVILKDARGNSTDDRVLVGFDNRPPTVLIEEPLDLGRSYNGTILLSGQAYDSMSNVVSVSVQFFKGSVPLAAPLVSATVPKWSVLFNAADPAFGLTNENLGIRIIATDEGGNENSYHFEYNTLLTNNGGDPVTASLIDELDGKIQPTASVAGLAFDKATLDTYRRDLDASTPAPPSILIVDIDSDKPIFNFITPSVTSVLGNPERFAGGSKANGSVIDDDLNIDPMQVWYRYALMPAAFAADGTDYIPIPWEDSFQKGYEQRWAFNLPGTNGTYRLQLKAMDNGGAVSESEEKAFIIDDGRPLVSIDTDHPTPWKLYYGKDQTVLVSGSASRSGPGNAIVDLEIAVGAKPFVDIAGATGMNTNAVSWDSYPLSLGGLTGGSTQVRVRAKDNYGVWGQAEVLIIMDVDAPLITITPPGSDLNGNVNFRGVVEDGAGDAFITVMDKVEARIDGGAYQTITGTYSWLLPYNTQAIADGPHTLWIRAYDKAGNVAEAISAFSVNQATDKPSLTITNLTEGMVIGGTYIISGTVSDDDGIAAAADGVQIRIENETSPDVWAVYQTWAAVTNRSGPQTNYSITYQLPNLPSGSYRISLRARDINSTSGDYGTATLPQANYWCAISSPLRFKVDNDVPVVEQASISPATGSYVNGGFSLSGNISEDQSLISARLFVNGVDRGLASIGGTAPNYSFNVSVDQSWLTGPGGVNSIRIDAADNSSPPKVGSATVQIIFDNTKPSASFLSPAAGSTVNGVITISGLANDDNQVSALRYAIRATSAGLPSYPGDYTLLADQRYSFNFTTNTALLADETAYTVYIVAADAAGNHTASAPAALPLLVSQNSDRPIVKLSNVRTDGSTVLKMVNTVFGSVTDDDGSVAKLEISEDGASWTEHPLSGGTFSYDSSAGDGAKTIYFRVTDSKGTVFSTSAASSLQKPRIETNPVESPAAYVDGPIAYSVDTAPPEINPVIMADRSAPFDFADELPLATNMPFGGASAQFRLRAQAIDSNGIASVNFIVPGAPGSPFSGILEGGYYRSPTIDAASLADGPLVMSVEAIDTSGLRTTITRTVIIDNSPPIISFTNPRSLVDVVNGNIEVKGLASDGGSGLKSVQYKVGYNHAAQSWQNVGGSLFSWQIDFKDANRIDIYANAVDGSDDNLDDIWQVPVLIRAEDNAGNVYTSTITDYVLLVDPSGDKPKAFIIYPDPAATNRTLGGNIRIFGTAEDDDGVQGVYMQIDVNGDGVFNASDVASNGVDWYNGGEGQLVSGTVSWNRTINSAQEFDPPGAGTRTIYFRVRARDIYGLDGAWSLPQLIDVDKNVPKIGSSIPLTLKQGGAEQIYVADAWLKGSWSLVGSVEDESGIDSIVISGDINGSLSANPSWFTNLGGDNYRFEIPITTEASAGRVSFTITALDKSTPQLQTSLSISVQADNQAPTLNAYAGALPIIQSNLAYTLKSSLNETGSGFGRVAFYFVRRDRLGNAANDRVYMPMMGNTFTYLSSLSLQNGLYYLSRSGASRPSPYTLVDDSLKTNANVRVGGLIRIGGIDRTIVSWDGATGTVGWADEVSISVTDYQIAYALIVDNQTVETPVYSGGILTNIINDDGDGMVESVERSGGLYSWTASIDSRNIPDGPIELHWVSFDKAGNSVASSLTTMIANNRPLLAAVTLGTDLDGNGTIASFEIAPAFSALDAEGKEQATAVVSSSSFIAKGLSSVDIDVVGGNGQLFYSFNVGGSDIHGGLQNLRSDGISHIDTIYISEPQLLSIGDGSRSLLFAIWDSTEETVPGASSLSAELTAPIEVRLIDTVIPKVVINPFYWNSASDNSLFSNNKLNGHIELTGVIDGTDPDVSGQISIRGTAYDDQRLTSIWMAIDGFSFAGAGDSGSQFDTNGDGVLETLSNTYYRLAIFNAGTWTALDRWATDGWKFTVTPASLGQEGHLVQWRLDWDSARVTNVAALNRVIRVLALDKRASPQPNASSETLVPSGGVAAKNVPSYQVDVVPYVSNIKTRLSNAYSSNWSVINRSALGYFPVAENELLEISGFNFNGTLTSVNVNGTNLGNPTAPNVINQYSQFRINTGAAATSGNLTIMVNGIGSINNLNNNEADYNKEGNDVNNILLNDDRKLYIWRFSTVVSSAAIRFPTMRVSTGPGQEVGFIYDSGAQFVRMNVNNSDFQVDQSFTQWYDTAFAIDSSGRAYGASMNGDSGGNADQDMNTGGAGWANFKYYAWNTAGAPGTNNNTNTSAYNSGTKSRAIENAATSSAGANFNPNRVQQPKMATYLDGATARVYMSYFDDINRQVRYRAGTVSGAANTPTFGGALINHDNIPGGSAAGFHTVASAASLFKPGQYSAVGITNDGSIAVIAWYDADARRLVYSWNSNPNAASQAQWQVNARYIDGEFTGWYVDLVVDSDNGIHIAYYNSSSGDLKYAYLSSYNADPQVVTVDSFLSTGTNVSISARKVGLNQIPYISYYMGAYTSTNFSLRTAWRSDLSSLQDGAVNDRFTGAWEVMTIPTLNNPKDFRVGIGIKNNGIADAPLLGYATTSNLETAHLK